MSKLSLKSGARLGWSVLALAIVTASTSANAVILETARIVTTKGQYSTKNPFTPSTAISGNVDLVIGSNPGFPNELGIDVFATADGPSFFFQNSLWRIGEGSAFFDTIVETTLTNTGPNWETLIFDSIITPGYLAVAGKLGSGNAAKFDFRVSQITGDETQILYSAFGIATAGSKPLVFSPTPFNDLQEYSNNDTLALTWGATPISLLLNPIAPGGSTRIVYDLQTYVTGPNTPVPGDGCQGSQVSFGDPRNPGGAMFGSFSTPPIIAPCSLEPVIGRRFDPVELPTKFTVVPEPASWAMLISGFGLTGAVMRRRRTAVA
jgi:hypothetical protein